MRSLLKLSAGCLMVMVVALLGCGKKEITLSPSTPETYPDTVHVALAGEHVTLEVVTDEASISRGLMFREHLDANSGMLFVFPVEGRYSFWMKNTVIPLSIAFLNSSGVVVGLDEMAPLDTFTRHQPVYPFLYAIEMNAGWFSDHGIRQGDSIPFPWLQ